MAQKTLLPKETHRRIWPGHVGPRSIPSSDELVIRIPGSAISFAAFRAWAQSDDFPEEGRISYVDGEVIVDMSHDEVTTHNLVKTEIVSAFVAINKAEKLGKVLSDGVRLVNVDAAVSNEPDCTFVSHASLKSGRASWTPRKNAPRQKIELVGCPDLVVEVVSNSSVVKDVEKLRAAYHAAGIPEYWLIDARGEEIVFQILNHRRDNYVSAPNRDGWIRSRVFRREFRLAREVDESDLWEYSLEVRSR